MHMLLTINLSVIDQELHLEVVMNLIYLLTEVNIKFCKR
jgi:hypothetical protein